MAKKKVSFEELLGIKKMQKIAVERLTPPKEDPINRALMGEPDTPLSRAFMKTIVSEKSSLMTGQQADHLPKVRILQSESTRKSDDSQLAIDFDKIANSSEFKRFIYYIFSGKTHRGSIEKLNKDINKMQNDVRKSMDFKKVVEDIKKGVILAPMGSYKYEPYEVDEK